MMEKLDTFRDVLGGTKLKYIKQTKYDVQHSPTKINK